MPVCKSALFALALPLTLALPADAAPRGTYIQLTVPESGPVAASAAPWVLYLNRFGGTFTPGHKNDSRENISIIPEHVSSIGAWDVGSEEWNDVYDCVRDQFARWDIEVTDMDPGNSPHIEAVVGGRSEDLGLPPGIGGVSPFRSNCSVIDNSIVYVFAEVYGDSHRSVCETVAQEVGHSLGLDHALLCEDPMTYLGGCGAKSFQAQDAACGENEERPCACGAATQNSVALLDARLGVFGGPRFDITSPAEGATLPPGFNVVGRAIDDDGLTNIGLLIDGVHVADATSDSFIFETPMLASGAHELELVAVDAAGNVGRRRIPVTIDPNASDPAGGADELDKLNVSCNAGGGVPGSSALLVLFAALALWRSRPTRASQR